MIQNDFNPSNWHQIQPNKDKLPAHNNLNESKNETVNSYMNQFKRQKSSNVLHEKANSYCYNRLYRNQSNFRAKKANHDLKTSIYSNNLSSVQYHSKLNSDKNLDLLNSFQTNESLFRLYDKQSTIKQKSSEYNAYYNSNNSNVFGTRVNNLNQNTKINNIKCSNINNIKSSNIRNINVQINCNKEKLYMLLKDKPKMNITPAFKERKMNKINNKSGQIVRVNKFQNTQKKIYKIEQKIMKNRKIGHFHFRHKSDISSIFNASSSNIRYFETRNQNKPKKYISQMHVVNSNKNIKTNSYIQAKKHEKENESFYCWKPKQMHRKFLSRYNSRRVISKTEHGNTSFVKNY